MIEALYSKLQNQPWLVKVLFSRYAPFRGARIKITHIASDFRNIVVSMPLVLANKNLVGTHFGGSLYSMCDPFFMLMLMNNLGPQYHVWDQEASIAFLKPGRSTVTANFVVSQHQIDEIKSLASSGNKTLYSFVVEVTDVKQEVIARVTKVLYIRLKPEFRPASG